MKILVLNSGSSSLKYQLFDMETDEVLSRGLVEKIGEGESKIKHKDKSENKFEFPGNLANHKDALNQVLEILTNDEYGAIQQLSEINAVGHRVVHGGESFKNSVLVTPEVKDEIRKLISLAPLHNPANLMGIEACEEILPGVPNVAVFDTAFHQTMTPEHFLYALPREYYTKYGIRRYGFHGTSHKYVTERACEILGRDYHTTKLVSCHVGNGASVTAVQNGNVVSTSLGFTPLEGLIMGTRCGDIDPAIVPFLQKQEGLSAEQIDTVMNKKSGILGLHGTSSDHRELEDGYMAGKAHETEIINIYTNRILKYIGSSVAYLNGVDVVVLTAGVLENSPVQRKLIVDQLGWLGVELDEEANDFRGKERVISKAGSKVTVIVVPTDEECVIAKDTYSLTK